MAVGGFTYYSHDWRPHADTQTGIEAALNSIISWMGTWTGWSLTTSLTLFVGSGADSGWYWVMEHTSGTRMVFAWSTWNASASFIHADNEVDGIARNTSTTYWGAFLVAYLAPSVAALGAGNPATASWLPAGSMKFARFGSRDNNDFTSTYTQAGMHRWHAMVRDDDVILGMSRDAHVTSAFDSVFIGSTALFDKLAHSADANALSGTGTLCLPDGVLLSETTYRRVQGFAANGTTRLLMTLSWNSAPFSAGINDREPWVWSEITVHSSSQDLDTNGVIVGNGTKGIINPEMLRIASTAIPERKRLVSGDMVHVGSGLILGYDTSNGGLA